MHLSFQSRYSSWMKKSVTINGAHHTSLWRLFDIFHELNFLFCINFLLFLLTNITPHHSRTHQWLFLLSQMLYNCCTFAPNNPYSYALSSHNGSIVHQIFCFYFHIFLFYYSFILFHFYFENIFHLQVCDHLLIVHAQSFFFLYFFLFF